MHSLCTPPTVAYACTVGGIRDRSMVCIARLPWYSEICKKYLVQAQAEYKALECLYRISATELLNRFLAHPNSVLIGKVVTGFV